MAVSGLEIREKAKTLGICIPSGIESQFEIHGSMVIEWNQRLNLTRIPEEEMAEKHFVDSLTLLLVPEVERAHTVIDVGSGAGFPGIPLKIARPELTITLVDSLGKRVKFLDSVIKSLNLHGVSCYHRRAEEIGQDKEHREQYDVALARAVAPLVSLSEYLLPLVRVGGVMVAMKGPSGREEIPEAQRALTLLGGRVQNVIDTRLPSGDVRQLIVIEKVKGTPAQYPRRPGMAKRSPLI